MAYKLPLRENQAELVFMYSNSSGKKEINNDSMI